jgi:uncharacterized cupin superfamily protein
MRDGKTEEHPDGHAGIGEHSEHADGREMSETTDDVRRPAVVLRAADVAGAAHTFSHPWNPLSEVTGTRMSMLGGLTRSGVSRVRVEPGKESFAYRSGLVVVTAPHRAAGRPASYHEPATRVPRPSARRRARARAHHFEEEWLYILSGRAIVTIDGVEHEVGPGDFVAFPTPSQAHQLANRFDQPVEYLMGGESRDFEVGDFPELNRRILRFGERTEVVPLDAAQPVVFEPPRPASDES